MSEDPIEERLRQNEAALGQLAAKQKDHDQRLIKNDEQIAANAKSIAQLISVVQGYMGRRGLVGDSQDFDARLLELESWQKNIKGFVAGVAFVGGMVGAVLSSFLIWALKHFSNILSV